MSGILPNCTQIARAQFPAQSTSAIARQIAHAQIPRIHPARDPELVAQTKQSRDNSILYL